MAIDITKFSGEIPRVHPRLLPDGFAQVSSNAKLENGVLTPYRKPRVIGDSVDPATKTIYKAPDSWLSWGQDVDVVQGPVDEERLYYTGVGVPDAKLRVAGAVYGLAIAPPTTRCAAALKKNAEYLTIEDKEIGIRQDRTTRTSSGSVATVSINNNTATIIIANAAGEGRFIGSIPSPRGIQSPLIQRLLPIGMTLIRPQARYRKAWRS